MSECGKVVHILEQFSDNQKQFNDLESIKDPPNGEQLDYKCQEVVSNI